MYGHPIGVHYRGGGTYSTWLGIVMSLVTIVLILTNTQDLFTKFLTKTEQSEFYQRGKADTKHMDPITLRDQNLILMLYSKKKKELPLQVGRWRAESVIREDWKYQANPIDLSLKECSQEVKSLYADVNDDYYDSVNVEDQLLMCLDETAALQGTEANGNYRYIKVWLERCNQSKDAFKNVTCASEEEQWDFISSRQYKI